MTETDPTSSILPPFNELFSEAVPSDADLQRMLDIAFDPSTPDPGTDLIPDAAGDVVDLDDLADVTDSDASDVSELDDPDEPDSPTDLHDAFETPESTSSGDLDDFFLDEPDLGIPDSLDGLDDDPLAGL